MQYHTITDRQLRLDLTVVEAARVRTVCAASTPITIDGVTRTAGEWAAHLGIKWQTVKMRRMRGDTWREALNPARPRGRWMKSWGVSLAQR